MELNKEKTTTVHNAKEGKGEEAINLNVESKSGKEFVNTRSIENVLRCNNIIDNRKIRKGRNTERICQQRTWLLKRKNNEMNFVKRGDQKDGIDLNAILVNLNEEKMSPKHPTSPT